MNVSVKNIWKAAWACGAEAFVPTSASCLEAEKKRLKQVTSKFFILKNDPILKLPCLIECDTENYDPYLN